MTSSPVSADVATRPKVAIVVVNWNGADDLRDCLPSLLAQEYPHVELIVVDNGSEDESADVVAQTPTIRWLPLGHNRGLAAALNEGAAATESLYILFLNNDMRFAPDFVARLVDALEADPKAFAADALQFDWEGSRIVHERTRLEPGSLYGEIPWYRFAQVSATEITTCAYASAANILVRRGMFDSIGGWDGAYPIGMEDVDLAWRAWGMGWRSLYVPSATCWHKVGASMATETGFANRLRGGLYGQLRFAVKHLPATTALVSVALGMAPLPADLLRGRTQIARARMHVVTHLARDLRSCLRARADQRQRTAMTPSALLDRIRRA